MLRIGLGAKQSSCMRLEASRSNQNYLYFLYVFTIYTERTKSAVVSVIAPHAHTQTFDIFIVVNRSGLRKFAILFIIACSPLDLNSPFITCGHIDMKHCYHRINDRQANGTNLFQDRREDERGRRSAASCFNCINITIKMPMIWQKNKKNSCVILWNCVLIWKISVNLHGNRKVIDEFRHMVQYLSKAMHTYTSTPTHTKLSANFQLKQFYFIDSLSSRPQVHNQFRYNTIILIGREL